VDGVQKGIEPGRGGVGGISIQSTLGQGTPQEGEAGRSEEMPLVKERKGTRNELLIV